MIAEIKRPDRRLRTNPAQSAPFPGGAIVVTFRNCLETKRKNGAPGAIRTPDLWFRRPTLYPAELQARIRVTL